jgi:hypothetical protein
MADDQAKISMGASPVAADRRHTYLLSDRNPALLGDWIVVRDAPVANRPETLRSLPASR